MTIPKDPISQGKSDWLNYSQKKTEIKENKVLDAENQENKVKIIEKKKEEQKLPPKAPHNPNGGMQLG
jgi:hypothetical protein